MVNDQEPRYRLVDANGNVVGSLFAESDGTLKLQEGTSGNDNELAFTSQGELKLGADEIGGFPGTSSSISGLSLGGSYEVIDPDRPALVEIGLDAQTDGQTRGDVQVQIDESGGDLADFIVAQAFAPPTLPAGTDINQRSTFYAPPGSSVSVQNVSDPNGENKLAIARKYVL